MTTLIESLGSLYGKLDDHAFHVDEGIVISAEAAQAAHQDAWLLARQRMRTALWLLLPAAAILALALSLPPYGLVLFPWVIASAAWATSATYRWWRLSRVDPLEQWHRDYQEDLDQSAAFRALVERMLTVRGIATSLLGAVVLSVTAVQFVGPGIANSVELAGLVKSAARGGEWWRLLSAAYLHGSVLHIYGNMLGLLALGRLVEAYSRPSRVALAFLIGAIGASVASMLFLPDGSSIGASGGVLGLVGYLLGIIGGGSARDMAWVRKQLWFLLAQVLAWGVIYYFVIDNAAHAGGVIVGYLLGLITARLDARAEDGRSRGVEILAAASSVIVVAGAAFTIGRLLQVW